MSTAYTTMRSPIGELLLVADDAGLTAVAMTDPQSPPQPPADAHRDAEHPVLRTAVAQLTRYFAGELTAFDLPLAPHGTPFQLKVWQALAEIPYGATTSYGVIATRLGAPGASRAVGLANGRNPIAVVVPCHRVIGSSGKLTGYGGGLPRKRYLLDLEARVATGRAEPLPFPG